MNLRRPRLFLILTLALLLLAFGFANLYAASATLPNTTFAQVDGGTATRTVTFTIAELGTNQIVDDVTITLDFAKIDDPFYGSSCNPLSFDNGSSPYNFEIFYQLTSPDGTTIDLITAGTYSNDLAFGGQVQVTLDDAAGVGLGTVPTTGTFSPSQALSSFDGESPYGIWTVTVGDDGGGDPLCHYGFDLTVDTVPIPANDDLANAQVIASGTLPIITMGDNTNATSEVNEVLCGGGSDSVWYSFTPIQSGSYEINTSGSFANYGTDTTLGLYTGAGHPLTSFGCNSAGTDSGIIGNLTSGNTYFIQVGSDSGGSSGQFDLNIEAFTFSYAITVTETGGTTVVTEDGTADSYTLQRTGNNPAFDVTVPLSIAGGECLLEVVGNGNGFVASDDAVLTAGNGYTVTVNVQAVNDGTAESAETCTIVNGDPTSTDIFYDSLGDADVADVTANVTDNDVAATLTLLTPTTDPIAENGGTSTVAAQLEITAGQGSLTAADFTVETYTGTATLNTDYSTSQAAAANLAFAGSPFSLAGGPTYTFNIDLTGIDDLIDEGADEVITVTISTPGGTAAGTGSVSFSLGTATQDVTIAEDDSAGFVVDPNTAQNISEAPAVTPLTVTFTLTSQPLAQVDIPISVSDATQCEIQGAVTLVSLDDTNWNAGTFQVVVQGLEELIADGDQACDLITGDPVSVGDATYAAFGAGDVDDVPITVEDNDSPDIIIDPVADPETISEFGPTATTFGLQLQTEPSAGTVTISITPDAQCILIESAMMTVMNGVGLVTFDPTTWDTPVPISAEAVDDLDIEGPHECILSFAVANSTAPEYVDLPLADLAIPVEDNDGDSFFSKRFEFEGPLPTFSTVNLFFTIRNTNGGTLFDVTFTDELPDGLTLASISAQVTDLDWEVNADCGDMVPSEDTVVGGSVITFEGGTLLNGAVCEIRVVVTSEVPGTYINGPENITAFAADGNPELEAAFEPTSVTFEYADSEVFDGQGEVAVDPSLDVFDPAISKVGVLVPGQTGVTGEQLEWIVTVTNPSSVSGTNVVITDTINTSMTVDNVVASGGTATIDGQTVTVTYATLAPGQSVSFSIFTTVVDGLFLDNTACMVADGVAQECASASVTSVELPDILPKTGESPWSVLRLPMLILLGLALLVGVRWRRKVAA